MNKINLTLEQKENFKKEFSKIVEESTPEVKKLWQANPSILFPTDDNPIIESGVQHIFSSKLKAKYSSLKNRLLERKI